MQSLKRFTAREGNRIVGLTGQPFWQDESYDRLVRNEREFERAVHYIESNPVTASLAATPEEFPWSSARPIDNRPRVDNLPHTVLVQILSVGAAFPEASAASPMLDRGMQGRSEVEECDDR